MPGKMVFIIWVRSRRCDCLVTWFCYQMIAKPGNKKAAPSWPDPYTCILKQSPTSGTKVVDSAHNGLIQQLRPISHGVPGISIGGCDSLFLRLGCDSLVILRKSWLWWGGRGWCVHGLENAGDFWALTARHVLCDVNDGIHSNVRIGLDQAGKE